MADVARVIWRINLIGTCQCNRIGADTDCLKDGIVEIGSYDSVAWQRKDGKLSFCVWGDNNLVKTLSNFHQPSRVPDGIERKRRVDGMREETRTKVSCPVQQIV